MGEFQFLKAKRENLYLKMLLSGVSGAGKTMSSLLLARGICEAEAGAAVSWSEIAFADCENKQSVLRQRLPRHPRRPRRVRRVYAHSV